MPDIDGLEVPLYDRHSPDVHAGTLVGISDLFGKPAALVVANDGMHYIVRQEEITYNGAADRFKLGSRFLLNDEDARRAGIRETLHTAIFNARNQQSEYERMMQHLMATGQAAPDWSPPENPVSSALTDGIPIRHHPALEPNVYRVYSADPTQIPGSSYVEGRLTEDGTWEITEHREPDMPPGTQRFENDDRSVDIRVRERAQDTPPGAQRHENENSGPLTDPCDRLDYFTVSPDQTQASNADQDRYTLIDTLREEGERQREALRNAADAVARDAGSPFEVPPPHVHFRNNASTVNPQMPELPEGSVAWQVRGAPPPEGFVPRTREESAEQEQKPVGWKLGKDGEWEALYTLEDATAWRYDRSRVVRESYYDGAFNPVRRSTEASYLLLTEQSNAHRSFRRGLYAATPRRVLSPNCDYVDHNPDITDPRSTRPNPPPGCEWVSVDDDLAERTLDGAICGHVEACWRLEKAQRKPEPVDENSPEPEVKERRRWLRRR